MDSFLNRIYHLDKRLPRARTKPMQVLALGLSRSGTESLCNALITLGYDHTYHGFDAPQNPGDLELWHRLAQKKRANANGDVSITAEDFDLILGHCVAVTDMPAVALSAELITAYPDAKVILNSRKDLDAWYRSNLATFGALKRQPGRWIKSFFCVDYFWLRKVFENPFYRFYYEDFAATGKWVCREHCAKIRGLVPSERLLEWSVEDGWEPLCVFLGKEVPEAEFPKGKMPQAFMEKVGRIHAENDRTAYRNMAICGALLGGAVAALSALTMRYW